MQAARHHSAAPRVQSDAERRGEIGRLGGMLFAFMAVVALVADQLLVEPVPPSASDSLRTSRTSTGRSSRW